MPRDFLKVESSTWNNWLSEPINVSWTEIPLKSVLDQYFGSADISIDREKKPNTPVTFDAAKLSRRETLWRLGKKYGFKARWEQKN